MDLARVLVQTGSINKRFVDLERFGLNRILGCEVVD